MSEIESLSTIYLTQEMRGVLPCCMLLSQFADIYLLTPKENRGDALAKEMSQQQIHL